MYNQKYFQEKFDKTYITTGEISERTGVPISTIFYAWKNSKQIEPPIQVGSKTYIWPRKVGEQIISNWNK